MFSEEAGHEQLKLSSTYEEHNKPREAYVCFLFELELKYTHQNDQNVVTDLTWIKTT